MENKIDLSKLKEKIPFQWRVQSFQTNSAMCVAYIDSRDVQEILDKVCLPENWQCDYKEIKGNLFCGIGIKHLDQWIWKWDCGTESNTEKEKGEASDSFKRAAVKWGIGRFLYDLDIQRIKWVEKNSKKYPADNNGNPIYDGKELTRFINERGKTATLYNHKEIETNGLPLVKNEQFKKIMERIRGGEIDIYYKAKAEFSFAPAQEKLLTDTFQELKKQKS